MSPELPSTFRISLNSFYGRSFSLILRDSKLLYNSTRPSNKIVRDPSDYDWQKFWKKTVLLKIWLWENEYLDKSSSDGSNWSVNIEVGNLKVKSYGSNSYPDNFDEFIQSVKELTAGLEFQK
ncbi:MAG: hypothetical protein KKD38_02495 [Candidatus Delongbacteria bacterium]|nr:hypothetical protein [Candidatus Delongbacteria bacterium]MCG2761042.1 hypothetical protein [Candidatus Delongbacteria bacterium]